MNSLETISVLFILLPLLCPAATEPADQRQPDQVTIIEYDGAARVGLGGSDVDVPVRVGQEYPLGSRFRLKEGSSVEVMVAHACLAKSRVTLVEDGLYSLGATFGSYHVLHYLDGVCELRAGNRSMSVHKSDTVFVPACLEDELRIVARTECSFFDDTFPSLPALTRFLGTHGAGADQIEALLSPPRAVPGRE